MVAHVNSPSATIAGTASSARTAYPAGCTQNGVYVYNSGTIPIYVKSGDATVVAAAGDGIVPAASARLFQRNVKDTHLAAITTSSTATVYFSTMDSQSQF